MHRPPADTAVPLQHVLHKLKSSDEVEQHHAARLYLREWEPIVKDAARGLRHREDAEDLISEVALKLCTTFAYEERGWAAARRWLRRVAENLLKNEIRRRSRRPLVSTEDLPPPRPYASPADAHAGYLRAEREASEGSPGLVDPADRSNYLADLDAAMAALDSGKRQVVWLYYYAEMKHRQIAQTLGIEEDASKQRLARGLKEMASLMRRWESTVRG